MTFLVNVNHRAESQPFTLLTVWFTSHKTAQHGVKRQKKWIPDVEVPVFDVSDILPELNLKNDPIITKYNKINSYH